MYRSAGNPLVAAAKANIWSQSTQEVLDSWSKPLCFPNSTNLNSSIVDPFDEEEAETKAQYQQELDS